MNTTRCEVEVVRGMHGQTPYIQLIVPADVIGINGLWQHTGGKLIDMPGGKGITLNGLGLATATGDGKTSIFIDGVMSDE